MATTAPHGAWLSPLSAADLVEGAVGLGHPCRRGARYFWQEARPSEQGRVALVSAPLGGGGDMELLPPEMSARTMLHEYGGRAWTVAADGTVVTSNLADQRLWAVTPDGALKPLTPAAPGTGGGDGPPAVRYGAPVISPDGAWVVCARESHLDGAVHNDLVAVSLSHAVSGAGGADGYEPEPPSVLAQGHDFYSSPSFSADGTRLAYVCWDHPEMPWDTTQLWQGYFAGGQLGDVEVVVPAGAGESVLQPAWGLDGSLYYLSDRTGWWGLYRNGDAVATMEAELGGPAWVVGESFYVLGPEGRITATWRAAGRGYMGTIAGGRATPFALGYTRFYDLAPAGPRDGDGVLAVAAGPTSSPQIVHVKPSGEVGVLCRSRPDVLSADYVSVGRPFDFPTGQGQTAHATFYPPRSGAFDGPASELPPLIVTSHGGPTAASMGTLNLGWQYWTTRGFALVDVDYRGSTGYGRDYRRSLYGLWGDADVEDCALAAQWLAAQGWADGGRMVIRGGSASGLTALAALARYDIFAAATVFYGVGDISALAAGTHKFESRYLDKLVSEGDRAARSPVNMVDRITAPVLFVQGLEDKVVPPGQSRDMVDRLRQAGVTAHLVLVEGEGHGFRKATTLVRAQELELTFYASALGFTPAGEMSRAAQDLRASAAEGGTTWP